MLGTSSKRGRAPRLIVYSHDSFGLGHYRRSLTIACQLLESFPRLEILGLTGSPAAHLFPKPERFNYVQLPPVTKDEHGSYQPRASTQTMAAVRDERGEIIRDQVLAFAPDILLIDHTPVGIEGELLPTLELVREQLPETRVWLGMRDIIDEPTRVIADWRRHGIPEILERFYDRIVIYGDRRLADPVREYGFTAAMAEKSHYAGYICRRNGLREAAEILAEHAPRTGRLVLVTVGGGEDGSRLIDEYLDGVAGLRNMDFESLIVTGPLMCEKRRQEIARRCRSGVRSLDFLPDLPSYLKAATLIVSMAGYNTVSEILSAARHALLIPRVHPRREQLFRTRRLVEHGLASTRATGQALIDAVSQLLEHPPPAPAAGLCFDGLQEIVRLAKPYLETAISEPRQAQEKSP